LFGFSSKAEARWPVAEGAVPVGAMAPPPVQVQLARRKRGDGIAPQKTSARWASCLASVRGHGRGSMNIKANRALLDVEAGASDELPPLVRQSFKDGRYSPSTGMEEREWQIMLEQFIVMGVVVKDKVIDIDSD
jgi:hypothetical protein